MDWGKEAERRLKAIARVSEPGGGVTRLPFTREHGAARARIAEWMFAAGLQVDLDAACTLIGRQSGPPGTPALLIGSHQDSVRQGGAYDGIMGIVLGCLAVEKIHADGQQVPVPVEILAFADEEGVRFPTALMGPRALAGTFDAAALSYRDDDGVTLAAALDASGGASARLGSLRRDPARIIGYVEAHIEQGPVLESLGQPVGIVTGICGIERAVVSISGATGHAGTVPMDMRRDALVAAARLIDAVHVRARDAGDVLATVGHVACRPNVVNSIPGAVSLTIEIRSVDDGARRRFAGEVDNLCAGIESDLGVVITLERAYQQAAVACDPDLTARLADAAGRDDGVVPSLPSGATHDASAMADLCPIAMLFVRCRGGISHSRDEFASPADMGVAVETLARFILQQGQGDRTGPRGVIEPVGIVRADRSGPAR